jgi:hypothetical protein
MRTVIRPDVRFGSLAGVAASNLHVRFTPESDIDAFFSDVRYGPMADIAPIRSPRRRVAAVAARC